MELTAHVIAQANLTFPVNDTLEVLTTNMQDCCFRGFQWDGTPKGKEDTLAGQKTYVTGDDKTHAILIGHDAIGWAWKNTRLLADHFAKEVGATVYLPDL